MQPMSSSTMPNLNNTCSSVWRVLCSPFNAAVTWIRSYQQDKQLLATANVCLKQLTELEMTPIKECNIDDMLTRVKNLAKDMQSGHRVKVIATLAILNKHIIALECRHKQNHTPDESHYDQLAVLAQNWKSKQRYFINKNLVDRDTAKLKEACQYDGFMQILLSDAKTREDFFYWTILNDSRVCPFQPNDVEVFVKFPGLYDKILRKLNYRNARFGGDLFQVDKTDQVLTVPLEGKRVKVLNNAKFEVKGHLGIGKMTVTFQDIFRELRNKVSYDGEGEFEILNKGGIWLWNAKKLGSFHEVSKSYQRIDLNHPAWVTQLPTTEILTFAEAEKRYKVIMDGKPDSYEGTREELVYQGLPHGVHPLYNLAGTQKQKYDLLGTHAYDVLLLVNRSSGIVEVKSIGQFLYPFPEGFWQLLWSITKFAPSYMYSPDENIFNANRQHAGDYSAPPVIVRPGPQEWHRYVQKLKSDIIKGWKDKLGFNFLVANCTTSAWKRASQTFGLGRIPDLRVRFWKLRPKGSIGKVYDVLKTLPERVSVLVFLLIGSRRRMQIINKYGEEDTVSLWYKQRPFKYTVHPAALFDPLEPGQALPV